MQVFPFMGSKGCKNHLVKQSILSPFACFTNHEMSKSLLLSFSFLFINYACVAAVCPVPSSTWNCDWWRREESKIFWSVFLLLCNITIIDQKKLEYQADQRESVALILVKIITDKEVSCYKWMKMTKSKPKSKTMLGAFLLSLCVSINGINRSINNRSKNGFLISPIIWIHGRSINNTVQKGRYSSYKEKLEAKHIPRDALKETLIKDKPEGIAFTHPWI